MASSGGKRAVGTDGHDFKYRQRVDDHYKLMAGARKALKRAARLQLGSAMGLATIGGTSFALPSSATAPSLPLCAAASLLSAAAARTGLGAAGAATLPAARLGLYSALCKAQLAGALCAGGMAAAAALSAEGSDFSFAAAMCVLSLASLLGGLLGVRSAASLARAFEEQTKKKATAQR